MKSTHNIYLFTQVNQDTFVYMDDQANIRTLKKQNGLEHIGNIYVHHNDKLFIQKVIREFHFKKMILFWNYAKK